MPLPTLKPFGQDLLAAQYDNMLSCVRCGLCLSVCPTYQERLIEPEGPRGRIAIAKALVEGNLSLTSDLLQHWDSCILCDACSFICPSGVHMEAIGQALRTAVTETKGKNPSGPVVNAMLRWVLPNMGLLRTITGIGRLYQKSGLQRLTRASGVLRLLRLEEAEAMLPAIEAPALVPNGQVWEPGGEHRATVALLAGCIMSTAFSETDRATARVLAANGCRVGVPAGQGCCGALHAHRGEIEGARALARRNIDALLASEADTIIVNAAGCGATLKHYGSLLADDPSYKDRAAILAAKARDFTEFLAELGVRPPPRALNMTVTYQEPCHLANAQRVREAPRKLLRAVPGLVLREMAESAMCCGSGALYNVTQTDSSHALRARKVRNAAATEAEVIVTANPGCFIQLGQGLQEARASLRVLHIADLLDQAYRL
ncbi:MAG: heterodisulfide reductase-related iron-sulfur binding cluster [Chloroflexota bacterium]